MWLTLSEVSRERSGVRNIARVRVKVLQPSLTSSTQYSLQMQAPRVKVLLPPFLIDFCFTWSELLRVLILSISIVRLRLLTAGKKKKRKRNEMKEKVSDV